MKLTMWKYVLAWIPMVFIAIFNGALREGWYGKHLGELQAHQVSTGIGVLLFGVYSGRSFGDYLSMNYRPSSMNLATVGWRCLKCGSATQVMLPFS